MDKVNLTITPKTKVGELLDAFPQLENVLLELSPSFAKLKNPILRKTVARVASLQQAAIVGGLKVDELVNRLRKEVGQDSFAGNVDSQQYIVTSPPVWFKTSAITQRFDASPIINNGGSPMTEILAITHKMQPGEILELTTPFVPAPIIDMLKEKDYKSFSVQIPSNIQTYFFKT